MNPLEKLTALIDTYERGRDSFNVEELQDLRDDISINFYHLVDPISKAISRYDAVQYKRKRLQSEKEEMYRSQGFTIAESENKARLDLKGVEKEEVEALRMKERARQITSVVPLLLHSISSRIKQIEQ